MTKIMLKNVRLSFPNVFKKATYNGEETKFEATFLINKDTQDDLITKIRSAITELRKEKLKNAKHPADKICLKDGDEIEYEGYADHLSIKASNAKRPMVINKDKSLLSEDDDVIYAGCYVNAQIELWAQNNAYGKRINCNLLALQFYRDGEPFGEGATKVDVDAFEAYEDEDDIDF